MTSAADGELAGYFRVAYRAVLRFPLLVAPPLAVGVLGFLVFLFIGGGATMMGAAMGGLMGGGGGMAAGGIAGLVAGLLLAGLTMGFLWLLSSCVVVVMAREALAGREPGVGDALGVVTSRLGAVVGAAILVTAIVMIGTFFFVLPGLVAAVVLIFTMPAVLLEGHRPVAAMQRSVALVRAHPGAVLGLVVGAILVLVAVGIASWIVGIVPLLGPLASFILHSAALSYLMVVSVAMYGGLARA
jgi:hypothetical protein